MVEPLALAVLWSQPGTYLDGALRRWRDDGHRVLLLHHASSPRSPHDDRDWLDGRDTAIVNPAEPADSLLARLEAFAPDAVLVSGWHHAAYRRAARAFAGHAFRYLCFDNQWHGTIRQYVGAVTSRWFVRPLFDAAFVPGERQAQLARRLGFGTDRVLTGLLAAAPLFGQTPSPADAERFVYAGALETRKGVSTLLAAYDTYRRRVARPWPLHLIGIGEPPQTHFDGVRLRGFLRPGDLAADLALGGTFVLPGTSEAWGVSLHEAATSGMPLVASSAVGAAVHLLRDGWNGYLVEPGDARHLSEALTRVSIASPEHRLLMGSRSRDLSAQFSPALWSANLAAHVQSLRSAA